MSITKNQCIEMLKLHNDYNSKIKNIIIDPDGRVYDIIYGNHDIALTALIIDDDDDRYEVIKNYGLGIYRIDAKEYINDKRVDQYRMITEYASKELNYFITSSALTSDSIYLYFGKDGLNDKQKKAVIKLYKEEKISKKMYQEIMAITEDDYYMKIFREGDV